MKKAIILGILTCIVAVLNAQFTVYHLTSFEDDWSFIEFDPPEGNIWQVGTPSKEFLDSAYSRPYALMTDTANLLYEPGEHSFILKLERPWWGNCLSFWIVIFYQKYSFDSLNSGGYVEVSYDHGETWANFVFDDYTGTNASSVNMYDETDTLINGEPAISSVYTWGVYATDIGHILEYPDIIDIYSVWLKFTYINLSTNNPHEGWLIDNLYFFAHVYEEYIDVKEINTFNLTTVYPNPASNTITIEIEDQGNKHYRCEIFNMQGKLLDEFDDICTDKLEFNISGYSKGQYIYKLSEKNRVLKTGKFIVK